MIENQVAHSPQVYDREILSTLRRIAWRDAERWIQVDLGDPWPLVCRMSAPPELGFAKLPHCKFVLDRLRAMAEAGVIQPAWREVDGRPRFGYIVPPRQKRKGARAKASLTDLDRLFLAELRILWDAPTGYAGGSLKFSES